MKKSTKVLLGTFSLTIYIAIIIGVENAWREPLFSLSLPFIEKWQTNSPNSEYMFFRVIYYFGGYPAYAAMALIIFFSQPINKSFTFLSVIFYSTIFVFLLKLAYTSPRPYWLNPALARKPCTGDFGNPSGHAMTSLPLYLSFWQIMTDYSLFEGKLLLLKYLLLIPVVGLIFTIDISLIYLGAHGINQVLYGISLGIVFHIVFFHLIKLHKFSGVEFFEAMSGSALNMGAKIQYFNIILLIVLILLYFFREINMNEIYLNNALISCPNLQWFEVFNYFSMIYGLGLIMGYSGILFGLVLLGNIADKDYPFNLNEINDWYKGNFLKHIYRYLLFIPILSPILMIILIPADVHYAIFYIFKITLPNLFLGFLIFGVYIVCCIKLKIANSGIYVNQQKYNVIAPPAQTVNDNHIV